MHFFLSPSPVSPNARLCTETHTKNITTHRNTFSECSSGKRIFRVLFRSFAALLRFFTTLLNVVCFAYRTSNTFSSSSFSIRAPSAQLKRGALACYIVRWLFVRAAHANISSPDYKDRSSTALLLSQHNRNIQMEHTAEIKR